MKYINIIFLLVCIFTFSFLSNLFGEEAIKTEDSLNLILKHIDETLNKIGNKKIAIVIQYDSPDLMGDSIEFKNSLIKNLVCLGKFEIVDSSFLGIKNISDLNIENAKKWFETINLGSIFLGDLSRMNVNEIKLNWRIIYLKDLTILAQDIFIIKKISNLLANLKKEIEKIKSSDLNTETKERNILKTIADYCKPISATKYDIAYFSCSIASEYCKKLNLKDGFYKIYYDDELVITVDKNGNILESYYYGKKNPVRKDINLEEFLKQQK